MTGILAGSNPSCIILASKYAPGLCRGRHSRFSLRDIGTLQEILTGLVEGPTETKPLQILVH